MARDFAKEFYNSTEWKECRRAFRKQALGLCERCRAKGLIRAGEIVHHKVPITPQNIYDPGITLSYSNLMLVCRDCHAELHQKRETRYKVDELGRVTITDLPPV